MRVMLLHHRSDFLGGAERSLVELARALQKRGVVVVCAVPTGPLANTVSSGGVTVSHVPPFRPRRSLSPLALAETFFARRRTAAALRATAEGFSPDVIHANSLASQFLAAGLRGNWKRVWHARDVPRSKALAKELVRGADAVVCVSEFVRKKLLGSGVDGAKLIVITHGIDLSRFEHLPSRDSARARLGIARGGLVVGCVSSLVPHKRVGLFVEAVELAREEMDVTAVIVGEAPPGAKREFIPERPWLARAGWRDDVPEILPAFDVFCAPSDEEPFGRDVVEAMAAGLPVVASDSGAHADLLEDEVSGVLFPAGDARACASALMRLARNDELKSWLGRSAKERAKEFSVERVGRETLSLYDSVPRKGT